MKTNKSIPQEDVINSIHNYFLKELNNLSVNSEDEIEDMKTFNLILQYNKYICKLIESLPTVETIKEGTWETVSFKTVPTNRISKAKKCSECGKRKDKYVVWNFCPKKKKKMRG